MEHSWPNFYGSIPVATRCCRSVALSWNPQVNLMSKSFVRDPRPSFCARFNTASTTHILLTRCCRIMHLATFTYRTLYSVLRYRRLEQARKIIGDGRREWAEKSARVCIRAAGAPLGEGPGDKGRERPGCKGRQVEALVLFFC